MVARPVGTTPSLYPFNGQIIAQRSSDATGLISLHGDHLGSVSLATNASGAVVCRQDFDPWGSIRSGGISQTSLNYTGQRRDGTGLLYYHARYYDPVLGRFVSADSVVPGAPDGSMDGVALKPLTVDFHETGFVTGLNAEHGQGFWFQNDDQVAPWGPANPQGLNRYSYTQNNPLKYTDPTGHVPADPRDGGSRGGYTPSPCIGSGCGAVGRWIRGLWQRLTGGAAAGAAGANATAQSVADKLQRYLLNPNHPDGASKAKWFEQALGYTRANMDKLAQQIVFDESKAVQTAVTEYGVKYNQTITIIGANGRRIDVLFGWIRNNDGVVRLVTAIPPDKK